MNRTRRNRIGLIVTLMTTWCVLSPAIAQQGEVVEPRFDIDFPGGTLSDYIDAYEKARPDGPPSIVVMPEALGLKVPPIKLVAITAVPAMEVLEGPYTTDSGLQARVSVRTLTISQSGRGKVVTAMKVAAEITSSKLGSAVWSVEEALVYGQTAEKILEAVEAAFSLFPTKAEISYHPPTRLLIVRGTQEQRFLVREMLKQLIDGAQRRSQDYSSLRERNDQLESERFRVTTEMRVAEKERYVARVVLERLMKMNEMPEEIAQAELEVTRAEANRMIRQQEGERLARRIAELREAMKRYEAKRE